LSENPNRSGHSAFCILHSAFFVLLGFAFGFAQACDAVAFLPLAPLLQKFNALKALEHIPFAAQCGSRSQTTML
jgi:hypothetical protein